MLSFIAAAPYCVGLALFCFAYFLAYPYIEYLRDPKGIIHKS